MRCLYSEVRVLASRVGDDGLECFTLIERTNNRGDRIHQLELLPFHIVGNRRLVSGASSKNRL
jgi:hypothetical protein